MTRRVTWFFAKHWIITGLLLAALAGVTAAIVVPARAQNIATQQWNGQFGGGRLQSSEIIRTQDQWQRLWQRLDRLQPKPLRAGEQIAVFLTGGEKPTAAYSLRLVSVTPRDDRLMVVWEEAGPDPERFTTQVISQPWMVVLIDRADLAPIIEQRVR